MYGLISVILINFSCLFLHLFLPGRCVVGYCCDNNFNPLKYKLNGLLIYFVIISIYLVLPSSYQLYLYNDYKFSFYTSNFIGFFISFYFYIRGGNEIYTRCITIDQIKNKKTLNIDSKSKKLSFISKFFLGSEFNPRFNNFDVKMFLYLTGAVLLQCNILSCLIYQQQNWNYISSENNNNIGYGYGNYNISNSMIVYSGLFSWFLSEYLLQEEPHLYTYDLFAEKLGFKLIWGCFVFYPYFYCIGIYSLTDIKPVEDITFNKSILIVILYFIGWGITRGANLQKFYYRQNPNNNFFFFGFIEQKTIHDTRILCSGFWGLARHFNYMGEIIQGFALALPAYYACNTRIKQYLPFLYPLYYCILFITRQIDDDAVCAAKYGLKWDEYMKIVPYRIIPFVY